MKTIFWLIVIVLAFSFCTVSEPESGKTFVVKEGKLVSALVKGDNWAEKSKIEGKGVNSYLFFDKYLARGNFEIGGTIELDTLNGTAASLQVFDSHFGFDSAPDKPGMQNRIFIYGPIVGETRFLEMSEKFIKKDKPFTFKINKEGKQLKFYINESLLATLEDVPDKQTTLALRPWRNKITIHDFYVIGSFEDMPQLNYVFEGGKDGYKCFRIPSILNVKGTLIAIAEGRVNGCYDTGDIDLVMKKSTDNGATWSKLQVIANDSANTTGNPSPIYDEITGELHLLYTWNLGSDHESGIIAQTSKDTRRVFYKKSSDLGETWTEPKEITTDVKQGNWTWYATGPGSGAQLKKDPYKGRLVLGCDHIEAETRKYFSHLIYSDDHGKTWNLGGTTPQDQVNECEVAELSNGDLMLNMRNYDRSKKARKVAISSDGGLTWSDIYPDTTLIEPICQASLHRHSFGEGKANVLIFSNPASKTAREKMTVRISYDDGETWQDSNVLTNGPSAYSDLVSISKNTGGIFYESGFVPYEGIVFETFPIPFD